MSLSLFSRVTRVGFLPLLLASNLSITLMLANQFHQKLGIQYALTISGNLLLMLYGSLVNDLCDRATDSQNPAAKKPFAQGVVSRAVQTKSILASAIAVASSDLVILAWLARYSQLAATLAFGAFSIAGIFFATIYSFPPVRARSRLFGATWTLMLYHPICLARLCAVSVPVSKVFPSATPMAYVFGYLWAVHGITTVAMKDVPDVFADRVEKIRSIPNLFGARVATAVSFIFIALSLGIALVAYRLDLLNGRFFLVALPTTAVLCCLGEHLRRWFERACVHRPLQEASPRQLFHLVGYSATWGVMIPIFVLNVKLQ